MKRHSIVAACVSAFLGTGLVMVGSESPVTADSKCTLSTVKGTYIYALDGFIVQGNDASQRTPFAQSGQETYDGHGLLTAGAASASMNGTIVRSTYDGTYTVNPDCSGTVTFTDNFAQTFHYDIFIRNDGREFVYTQTDTGVVTAGYERRK